MIRLGDKDDDGGEEGYVEHHHDENGKMEKIEKLISICADKADKCYTFISRFRLNGLLHRK